MVTRKPVPSSAVPVNNPPYPTDSTLEWAQDSAPRFPPHDAQDQNPSPTRSRRSSASSTNTWNSGFGSDDDVRKVEMPQALKIGPKAVTATAIPKLPDSLTPGLLASSAALPQQVQQNPWATQENTVQQPLQSHNPFIRAQKTGQPAFGGESTQHVWGDPAPSPLPPTNPPPAPPAQPPQLRTPIEQIANAPLDTTQFDEANYFDLPHGLQPSLMPERPGAVFDRQHSHSSSNNPWQDDLDRQEQRQRPESMPSASPPSLIETLPPPKPPRPAPTDASHTSSTVPDTSTTTTAQNQRNETYQIKHINWLDHGKIRSSPILIQNLNGPCPLLALVNALTLSTPDNTSTALVETLRPREQVSLGLLLDAVFEELARRNEISHHALPDVGDLYSFLITLHTGMNVNPCFVAASSPQRGSIEVQPVTIDGMHPAHRTQAKPGVFEETREMRLYSTFDIPLIHGWVPPADSQAYLAFDRSAKTFDEALNIQFHEEELEDKLGRHGLDPHEQQLLEDIMSIKQFLAHFPTQLTEYGLNIASKSMRPGQIAILFRNDHFSTLYKEPRSGNLMTLVTDAGYSSHDEIVWETLVDVSGAASELLSGDFRPVGNSDRVGTNQPNELPPSSTEDTPGGWETVLPHRTRNDASRSNTNLGAAGAHHNGSSGQTPSADAPQKTTEQEDHDLALALQLQEEEEDSQRREQATRRQREEDLSRQFLESETTERPPIPPRRSNLNGVTPNSNANTNTNTGAAPSADAPYVRASSGADDHPPSYEQAASDRPYRPPGSGPRQQQGNPLSTLDALERQQDELDRQASAYAAQSNMSMHSPSSGFPGMSRRRSSLMGSPIQGQRLARRQSQVGQQGGGYGDRINGQLPPGGRIAEQERCVVM